MLRNSSLLGFALAVVAGIAIAGAVAGSVLLVERVFGRQPVIDAGSAASLSAQNAMASVTELTPSTVGQGGAFAVEIHSQAVAAAAARFQGREYPMVNNGSLWFAVVGVGQPVGSIVVLPAGQYPVQIDYQLTGKRGVAGLTLTLTVQPVNFPTDALDVSAALLQLTAPELEAEEGQVLRGAYSGFSPSQGWQGPFSPPVDGEVSTVFGAKRSYNGGPVTGSHEGIDIAVPFGTPVHASAAGTVAWTGSLPDRGQGVVVDHGLGLFTGYYHLSEIDAQVGQAVAKGDVIGLVGTTGFSTGPHVHWEVVVGETDVDGLMFERLNLP